MPLSPGQLDDLRRARDLIETPSLAARITNLLGKPIESGVKMLPDKAIATINSVVKSALDRAQGVALATMADSGPRVSSDRWHKLATATSGAIGGFFGLGGLAVELPITTVIMLRSIGDVARSEGNNLADPEVRMACLEVFALGGPESSDDGAETGYYAVRAGLGKLVSDAAQHVAQHGMASRGAPALIKLIERIASRFGLVVQEKVALEMIPAIGAVTGALINALFMSHFQNVARGHFIVRRLEAEHGLDAVKAAYERLGRDAPGAP